jgi:hypothetical protein
VTPLELRLPVTVIRLRRVPAPRADFGYRWHAVQRDAKGKTRNRTVCGLLLRTSSYRWEGTRLEQVKTKDLCIFCFGALLFDRKGEG